MDTYHLYQVDSFTKEKFLGNPAGVITNADSLTEEKMQRIAKELNNSETAFILSPTDETHDVHIRFFTPQKEVPICGHATIAAHYVRAIENHYKPARIYQKSGVGILPIDIICEDNDYKIVMTQGVITYGIEISGEAFELLLLALGIKLDDLRIDCPVCIVSTGHAKVMIGIQDINLLHRLSPNMELLIKVSTMIGCNGFYVFTLHPNEDILIHGRMFAPAVGVNEDPVTGNANAPLGAYLVHYGLVKHSGRTLSFTAMQGEAINRTGTMEVQVDIDNNEPIEVRIVGKAVIAFSTELTI